LLQPHAKISNDSFRQIVQTFEKLFVQSDILKCYFFFVCLFRGYFHLKPVSMSSCRSISGRLNLFIAI